MPLSPSTTSPMMPIDRCQFPLYHHLIFRILECHYGNYGALFQCALVNKEFYHAASTLLYRVVVLSPPASQLSVLNLRDTGEISVGYT
jgi:hypothetical protein